MVDNEALHAVEAIRRTLEGYQATNDIELLEAAYKAINDLRKDIGETLALYHKINK